MTGKWVLASSAAVVTLLLVVVTFNDQRVRAAAQRAAGGAVQQCGRGSIAGVALVYQGTEEFQRVPGYFFNRDDQGECRRKPATAMRTGEGIYHVRLTTTECPDGEPLAQNGVNVSPVEASGTEGLVATYRTLCVDSREVEEVRIRDLLGNPTDAAFTATLLIDG